MSSDASTEHWRSVLRPWPDAALTVAAIAIVATAHATSGRPGVLADVVATAFLVPLVLVDLRVRRLPDRLTLGGTAAVLAALVLQSLFTHDTALMGRALLGSLAMGGFLLVLHLISPDGMGFGDVKLGLLLGALVGSQGVSAVLTALLVGGLVGSAVGLLLMASQGRRGVTLPFGPCLVAGAVVALVLHGG